MSVLTRVLVGAGAAVVGSIFLGPAGAYGGWKLGGALATGNPLHLIPGTGLLADGMDVASSAGDIMGGFADADSGFNVHGNPNDTDIHNHRPTDIQGNEEGRNAWGWSNNRTIHG